MGQFNNSAAGKEPRLVRGEKEESQEEEKEGSRKKVAQKGEEEESRRGREGGVERGENPQEREETNCSFISYLPLNGFCYKVIIPTTASTAKNHRFTIYSLKFFTCYKNTSFLLSLFTN
jgi:hypothetical protein